MKLTKENIYINLQGKSKEYCGKVYDILNSNGEKTYPSKIEMHIYSNGNERYHFSDGYWTDGDVKSAKNKQEVTIEQLKEILQPMENKEEQLIKEAKERGFLTEGNEFYSCFDDKNELRIIKPYDSESELNLYIVGGYLRYHDGLNNEYDESLCSNPAIYKDGVWAEIKNNNLTLTEQLERAEAEVKRLKEAIEEESKPKEITIDISKFDIEHLIKMRNYFGENDKTTFEHASYGVINRIIKQINKQIKRIN